MNIKNGLISPRGFLRDSFLFLFVVLVVFLSSSGFLKAQEEAEPPGQVAPAQPPSVIATTDGEYPNVRVEVTELKRTSGNTITLKFAMINDSSDRLDFSYNFGDYLGSIDGVHLIDAVGKKKYLVLRDTEGKCVCSRGLQPIEPGSRANLYAKFPAPPENVEKIIVVIPHFIPMDDVPMSK